MSTEQNKVIATPEHALLKGTLPEGCKKCILGEKLVLYETGLCGRHCWYCPVSENKIYHDVTYANEWNVETPDNIIEEAQLTEATGAGITGGDPLVTIDRTCEHITLLKQRFGKKFHIHLYTSLNLATKERLSKLHTAGLDEIRFHLDLDDQTLWPRLALAKKFSWGIGIELPCIPGKKKELLAALRYAEDKAQFFNLNELELSEPHSEEFHKKGHHTRNNLTYAIKGSAELAKEILEETTTPLTLYFCTAKLKDGIQLSRRIKRRAKNAKHHYDEVTSEGLLIRGALYLSELAPGFDYRKKLAAANKQEVLNKLEQLKEHIITTLNIPAYDIHVDTVKLRLTINKEHLQWKKGPLKKKGLLPAIVEEYPTRDAIEVDVKYL